MKTTDKKTNLSGDDQKRLVDFVSLRYDTLKAERADTERKWRENWNLFVSYVNTSIYPYISHLFYPKSYSLVKKFVANAVETVFATGKIIETEGVEPECDDAAREMEALQLDQYRRMKLEVMAADIFTFGAVVGTAYIKPYWKIEKRKRRTWGDVEVEGINIDRKEAKVEEEVTYDDVHADVIDPWDVYLATNARNTMDPGGLVHAEMLNHMELRGKGRDEGWFNTDLAPSEEAADLPSAEKYDEQVSREDDFQGVLVLTYWGKAPERIAKILDATEDDELCITISKKHEKLHFAGLNTEPHGKRPFAAIKINARPNRLQGEGILQDVKNLQHELNDKFNQMNDIMGVAANPVTIVDEEDEDKMRNFVYHPGAYLPLKNPAGMKFEGPKSLPTDLWKAMDVTSNAMEETTSLHRYTQGLAPERSETATGIISIQRAGALQMLLETRIAEATGFEDLAEMIGYLNQDNIKAERKIRDWEKGFGKWRDNPVSPDSIRGRFDYKFLGSTKQKVLQRVRVMFPTLYKLMAGKTNVNQFEMDKLLFESFGIEDPEKLLKNPVLHAMKAARENDVLLQTGDMEEPTTTDDHRVHIEMHTLVDGFKKLKLTEARDAHVAIHNQMMGAVPEGAGRPNRGGEPTGDEPGQVRQVKKETIENARN